MKLIRKMFGGGEAKAPQQQQSQFADTESAEDEDEDETTLGKTKGRNAPRRELVQITLRETMRRHGIPSDWIDCRTLSVLTRQHKTGLHVQFLVRKADYEILPWIHALQESFWEQILQTDPKAHDWLFSVGWEFYGKSQQGFAKIPGAGAWGNDQADTQSMAEAGDTQPPDDDDVAMDLKKLQALMAGSATRDESPGNPKA